jgi:hypothetical protein
MISKSTRRMGLAGGVLLLVGLGVGTLATSATAAGTTANAASPITAPPGFTVTAFAAGGSSNNPDDITTLFGKVFIGYSNGVGPDGAPSPTGQKESTVVEYTQTGKKVASWNVVGKVDGLTADRWTGNVVATVNEDANSSLYTITPWLPTAAQVKHYQYSPSVLPHGGGTDSIAVYHGKLYITASNPSPNADGTTFSAPALYEADLSGSTAKLTPVLKDNAVVKDAVTGKSVTLNLSDPDSSGVMPADAPRFAGNLVLDSQADQQLVFLNRVGGKNQTGTVLNLSAQVDDTAVASDRSGTLYLSDTGANTIYAVHGKFQPGSMYGAVGNGTIGQINLKTGAITTFAGGFKSPHGLIFVAD